jgi:hypothetical protein
MPDEEGRRGHGLSTLPHFDITGSPAPFHATHPPTSALAFFHPA